MLSDFGNRGKQIAHRRRTAKRPRSLDRRYPQIPNTGTRQKKSVLLDSSGDKLSVLDPIPDQVGCRVEQNVEIRRDERSLTYTIAGGH